MDEIFIGDEVVPTKEQDEIFKVELELAAAIRKHITDDLIAGKFNVYELAGRLNMTKVQVQSMLTRKTWVLRFALLIAYRLGYAVETMAISEKSENS